jgi:hypothetical protein
MNDYWIKDGMQRIRAQYLAGNITKHQAKTIKGQVLAGQIKDIEGTLSRTVEKNRTLAKRREQA